MRTRLRLCFWLPCARGEATDDSGADLLIDGDSPARGTASASISLRKDVEAALGKKSDIITADSIDSNNPLFRSHKLYKNLRKEKIFIYRSESFSAAYGNFGLFR
jgi:predicted nucleotidyltransferase